MLARLLKYGFSCFLIGVAWQAQAQTPQFTPIVVQVPLEAQQASAFTLVFSNVSGATLPAQVLRHSYVSSQALYQDDLAVTRVSGPCGAWRDSVVSPSIRSVDFDVPEIANGASVECRYSITNRLTRAISRETNFYRVDAPTAAVPLKVLIGVLTDVSATATLLSSEPAAGGGFTSRFRINFRNNSAFTVGRYNFSTCDFPGVPRLRMNFPGGCESTFANGICFAVGVPQGFTGPSIPAGGQASCEVEAFSSSQTVQLSFFELGGEITRLPDNAQMVDTNALNNRVTVLGPVASVQAPTLGFFGLSILALLMIALVVFRTCDQTS
jgi:hypothetical protein